jgi:hypothetical protein
LKGGPRTSAPPFREGLVFRVLIAALGFSALLLGARAVAAADDIEVLSVGWDNTVVPGTWTPVRMRVTGGGSDVTARVEVIVKFRPPAQGAPITFPDQMVGAYGQDVALPAGAMKEFTVWVPTTASQTNTADVQPGTVRLVANGQRLAQQDIEFRTGRTPQWPLVGVLAEAPVVQRAVGGVAVQYQGLPVPVSIAALSPTDVPTFGERLRAFKAPPSSGWRFASGSPEVATSSSWAARTRRER